MIIPVHHPSASLNHQCFTLMCILQEQYAYHYLMKIRTGDLQWPLNRFVYILGVFYQYSVFASDPFKAVQEKSSLSYISENVILCEGHCSRCWGLQHHSEAAIVTLTFLAFCLGCISGTTSYRWLLLHLLGILFGGCRCAMSCCDLWFARMFSTAKLVEMYFTRQKPTWFDGTRKMTFD